MDKAKLPLISFAHKAAGSCFTFEFQRMVQAEIIISPASEMKVSILTSAL